MDSGSGMCSDLLILRVTVCRLFTCSIIHARYSRLAARPVPPPGPSLPDWPRGLQSKLRRSQVPFACDRKGFKAFLESLDSEHETSSSGARSAGPASSHEARNGSVGVPQAAADDASGPPRPAQVMLPPLVRRVGRARLWVVLGATGASEAPARVWVFWGGIVRESGIYPRFFRQTGVIAVFFGRSERNGSGGGDMALGRRARHRSRRRC